MKNPKASKVMKVIQNFQKVLPSAMTSPKKSFDMNEPGVDGTEVEAMLGNNNHICNTTMCHGGWYAAAVWEKEKFNDEPSYIDYESGANVMAQDLGFYDHDDLQGWASENPGIWGNTKGGAMFSEKGAFRDSKKRPRGAKNLADVVQHWQEVHNRLVELENKPKVKKNVRSKKQPA